MLNTKNSFNHIHGDQVNGATFPINVNHTHYLRESHKPDKAERGIRKDKKVKIHRKFT